MQGEFPIPEVDSRIYKVYIIESTKNTMYLVSLS